MRPRLIRFPPSVRTIVGQQLSTKAAATIHRRLLELLPDGIATPEALDALTDAQLRQVGMSRQKSSYVRDLSAKAASGELHLDRLAEMTDDQVIEALTKVKGLGRWSAEMFLMFRLRRPDVLPVDDLGIVNAIHRLYKLPQAPRREADPPARRGVAAVSDGGVLVSVEKSGKHAARYAEAGRSASEADPVRLGSLPQKESHQRGDALKTDRYTKLMLTIIAACLVWLCAMNVGRPAQAQQLTAMPAALPGGAQPVVIVGWGTMDMTGRIALQLMGNGNAARTDATVPVRADHPLSVTLPYTPDAPLPTRLSATHDNPVPVEIAAVRKNGKGWEPIRTEVEPAPTRDKPGGGER